MTGRIVGYAVGERRSGMFPPSIDDVHPTRKSAEEDAKALNEVHEWTTYCVYEVREVTE